MAREWTVEELIRNRAETLTLHSPEQVLQALTVESYPDHQVPLPAIEALRKFRKMSTRARSSRVHRVLEFRVISGPGPSSSGTFDTLLALLAEILPPTTHPTRRTRFVRGLVDLIDERISLSQLPVAAPQPSAFRWSSRSPLIEECWSGPVVVGSVSCVRVESDGSAGIYDAVFGTGVHAEKIPGQHAFEVAKRRVEERYREWVSQTLGLPVT